MKNSLERFFFYILCEVHSDGYHLVGYFSKAVRADHTEEDKNRPSRSRKRIDDTTEVLDEFLNLSCLMVMPHGARKGYGKLLIDMSYALSRLEGIPGGPEHPLSDLGQKTYVSYWTRKIIELLMATAEEGLSINDIKELTGMTSKDVLYILNELKILY